MKLGERLKQSAVRSVMAGMGAWEKLESGISFNLMAPGFMADPHPVYRSLRERDPVHRSRVFRGWLFTRYDDVVTLLRDSRLSTDPRHQNMYARIEKSQLRAGASREDLDQPTMLNSDGARHKRLRGLVSKAFTPRTIQALEGRMAGIVDEMLDATAGKSSFDVIDALAYPLPVIIIAELLGIPVEDRDRFRHWSDEAVRGLGFPNDEDMRASVSAAHEIREYLEPIAEQRRKEPRDDLLSGLVAAEDAGDRLSRHEVFRTVMLLLIAGNETTTKLIGNGMLALLNNPEQLELLRDNPALIDTAVDELLRWDGPIHTTARAAIEDFEYQGANIKKGQMVMVGLAAANRDPAMFKDPERLDITRVDNPHVSLGHGMHFCLGASLARLEAKTALLGLIQRYPTMKLASDRPNWGPNPVLRGPLDLVVRV